MMPPAMAPVFVEDLDGEGGVAVAVDGDVDVDEEVVAVVDEGFEVVT